MCNPGALVQVHLQQQRGNLAARHSPSYLPEGTDAHSQSISSIHVGPQHSRAFDRAACSPLALGAQPLGRCAAWRVRSEAARSA